MKSKRHIKRTDVVDKDTVNLYAQMLCLSREGLRYYEQKGLIFPKRDRKTGYRLYGGGESIAVITCRKYRRYGLSINGIQRVLAEPDPAPVLCELERQHKILQAEIEEKQRILSSFEKKLQQLRAEAYDMGNYSVVYRPPFFWKKTRENKLILDTPTDTRQIQQWNDLSPYTDAVTLWSLQRLLTGDGDVMAGHIIEEADTGTLPLADPSYLPSVKCLYTMTESVDYINMSSTLFNDMLSYMKEHGLTPIGDAVARHTRMYIDSKKEYHFFSQLWIPIP